MADRTHFSGYAGWTVTAGSVSACRPDGQLDRALQVTKDRSLVTCRSCLRVLPPTPAPRPAVDRGFRTQADAVREARTAIWGDVPFSRRECYRPTEWVSRFQAADLVFAADVNGRLFVFELDCYGRRTGTPRVLPRA